MLCATVSKSLIHFTYSLSRKKPRDGHMLQIAVKRTTHLAMHPPLRTDNSGRISPITQVDDIFPTPITQIDIEIRII